MTDVTTMKVQGQTVWFEALPDEELDNALAHMPPTQPGDNLARDAQYTCMGSKAAEGLGLQSLAIASLAEPATWKANP